MAFELDKLVRENVKRLVPYSSARSEFTGEAKIFLDANENSFGSPIAGDHSRYPDPLQAEIKAKIAETVGVQTNEIFVGNGSDEAIDLLLRIFCRPGIDNIVICPPTYGMYEVAAAINDVEVRRACLTAEFGLDVAAIKNSAGPNTKLIFVCSPNNPTGDLMARESILEIAAWFNGIVVVDEAYIHFADSPSLVLEIDRYPNLVVLQTFSKAWGLAGLRVGMAFADAAIINYFNKVKPPYNVSQAAQELVLKAFQYRPKVVETIAKIVVERDDLAASLVRFAFVKTIYPSAANFLLVKMADAKEVYRFLVAEKIVVRDRSNIELCQGCLRITIGTPEENQALLKALEKYEKTFVY